MRTVFSMLLPGSPLGLPLYFAPPDAGGDGAAGGDAGGEVDAGGDAGGDADADAGADADIGEAGGDATRRAAADADVDPEQLEYEETIAALPIEQQIANLKTRLRRTQRHLSGSRQVLDLFRDDTGKALPQREIQRRLSLAHDMEELEGFFGEHPDVLQTILERKRGGGKAAAAPETFVDPYADEDKLPFDTTSESGRFFLQQMRDQARREFELRQTLNELRGGVQGLAKHTASQADQQVESNWKTQTLEAAKTAGLDGEVLKAFVNAVYGDYRLGRAEKRLARLTPAQAIQRHLGFYASLAKQSRRTTVASQHRRVAANGDRPGPQARGAATTARDTKQVGTIKDARKSFFDRVGQAPNPR